jgi:PAS domain S-box-containing protein
MSAKKRRRQQKERQTIGLLLDRMGERYQAHVWPGVADAAQEKGANLICFPGRSLRAPYSHDAHRNVLYDLVGPENVDGLVILSGSLGNYVPLKEAQAFCDRFRPLPMVSIALGLEGIPSLVVDNYSGVRQAVDHLIERHDLRRIAFIRGPEGHQEADERFRAYTDSLARHGIPLDPQLVAPGDFVELTGGEAVRILLDERKASFEAVVAANDDMALGALRAMQLRGIRVPRDVALVGFDDVEMSSLVTPPLTTIHQPLYDQGRRAAELLLDLLAGRSVPERIVLDTRLVTRQSCGCPPEVAIRASALSGDAVPAAPDDTLADHRASIVAGAAEALGERLASRHAHLVEDIAEAFESDLEEGSATAFLAAVSTALDRVVAEGESVGGWQDVLSELRRRALPFLAQEPGRSAAEDLWQQARVLVGRAAQNAQAFARLQSQRWALDVLEGSHVLMTTFDVPQLLDAVVDQLPPLGARTVLLSLYEGQGLPSEESRLILAYDENGRRDLSPEAQRFPSRQLMPEGLLSPDRQRTLFVEPLHFREEQLGFAVVEMSREGMLHEMLWRQVSTALKGALLLQEKKEAQQEMRRLMEFNEGIVQTIAEGIALQDYEGRFLFVNPALAFRLGYEVDELVDRDWTIVVPPDQHAVIEQADDRRRRGAADRYEVELLHKDGRRIPFLVSATPRFADGKFSGSLAGFTDISDRKEAERVLAQQADELSRSNTELEQFAFVAAHHLQEPLRAIAGHVQMLQRRYADRPGSDAGEYIDQAVKGAISMRRLINDLLDYSRVQTHGQPFRRTDCSRLLKQALSVLWPMIEETEATVTHDTMPTVIGDSSQLNRVFHELVLNAIKFRNDQPPRIHVGAEEVDGEWRFSVQDNGPGIEPQYVERIFKLFQRLNAGDKYEGTGIGLALCRKIVERHGGRIWVESKPGQGSTFRFTIPARREGTYE